MLKSKKYHLWTIGCQMNEADSRHLASQLETIGFESTTEPKDADLVVLNTCVVRQQAENKIYGRLGSLKTAKEKNPDLTIGLMGCMVGMKEAPALKHRFPYVDVFMPPSDSTPLIDYLEHNNFLDDLRNQEQTERSLRDTIQDAKNLLPIAQRGNAITAFVPIVLGCSHACTFCIIPYRRGVERSRLPNEILTEIRTLVSQGIKEVMLLGQIVDRYGTDLENNENLSWLLREIHKIDGLERIRFLTSHPNWMTDDLLHTVGELDKVCPHIEIPVQAGNNEVLTNMRRGYTCENYRILINKIRNIIPGATINTDIIVGFPGESHEQFMDTHQLVKDVEFDKIHISKYSMRPKTIATRKMNDNVTDEEKTERRNVIDETQHEILEYKNKSLLGQTLNVLVENKKKDRWFGRTMHNKLVFFDDDRNLLGETIRVKINKTSPYSLIGDSMN